MQDKLVGKVENFNPLNDPVPVDCCRVTSGRPTRTKSSSSSPRGDHDPNDLLGKPPGGLGDKLGF